jgi:sporulation protein YlmC with PRC-barrel domain
MTTINARQAFSLLAVFGLLSAGAAFAQRNLEPAGSEGGVPKHYKTLPVPRGPLESTEKNAIVGKMVKDKEGKELGTLEKVIVDTGTGRIEAGVIGYTTANNTLALLPVSWRDMKIDPKSGEVSVMRTSEELLPETVSRDTKDISPDVQALVKDMQQQIAQEPPPEMKIEVTMKDKQFHVEGHTFPGVLTSIIIRNRDNVTHGFSSNLFKQVRVRKEGEAEEVTTKQGTKSFHVDPGKVVTLYFTKGRGGEGETIQYPFWCDIHGNMRDEFLVVETNAFGI